MQPATRVRRLGAACLAIGLGLIAAGTLAGPASADHVEGITYADNPGCAAGEIEFKINQPGAGGVFEEGDPGLEVKLPAGATLPVGFEITISNVVVDATEPDKSVTFDWAASSDAGPVAVNYVRVKFASGGLLYSYNPPVSGDTGLVAPQDSISHLTFCGGARVNPTDGGTDDTTTTTEGTTTTTASVLPTVVTQPPTGATQPPTQVAGNVVRPQTLPVTGSNDRPLAIIGAAVVLIGGGTLLYRRGLFRS